MEKKTSLFRYQFIIDFPIERNMLKNPARQLYQPL
jgi:hypothetical protein